MFPAFAMAMFACVYKIGDPWKTSRNLSPVRLALGGAEVLNEGEGLGALELEKRFYFCEEAESALPGAKDNLVVGRLLRPTGPASSGRELEGFSTESGGEFGH